MLICNIDPHLFPFLLLQSVVYNKYGPNQHVDYEKLHQRSMLVTSFKAKVTHRQGLLNYSVIKHYFGKD